MNKQRGVVDPITLLVAGLVLSAASFVWSLVAPQTSRYAFVSDGNGGYSCLDTATKAVAPCKE